MPNKFLYFLDKFLPVYGRDRILMAESEDGVNWERHLYPVVNAGQNQITDMASQPFVWIENGKYHMLFSGGHNLREEQGVAYLFYKNSIDGYHWELKSQLTTKPGESKFFPRLFKKENGSSWIYWLEDYKDRTPLKTQWNNGKPNFLKSKEVLVVDLKGKKILFKDFNIHGNWLVGVDESTNKKNLFFAKYDSDSDTWIVQNVYTPKIPNTRILNNPSLVKNGMKWNLYFRHSFYTPWKSSIWCAESFDLKKWNLRGKTLGYSGWPRKELSNKPTSLFKKLRELCKNYELCGIEEGDVVFDGKKYMIFYVGYFGWHLLMPYTYWFWRIKTK